MSNEDLNPPQGWFGFASQEMLEKAREDGRRMRRNSDPVSSHVSAEKMAQGASQRHREQLLDLIRAHPGRDVSGLVVCAQHDGLYHLDRAAVSKRLSELHERGLISHPPTTGKARRWFAT